MRKIIAIAATTVAIATFSASANPYDASGFPSGYSNHRDHSGK